MSTEITKIECYWDTTDPENAGWYAMARDAEGNIVDDSMKVWFPVDVDDYDQTSADALESALREAFPAAQVVMS